MTIRTFARPAALVAACLVLAACSGGDLSGTYADSHGMLRLVFKDGNVTLSRFGATVGVLHYKVSGKEITLSNPNNGQTMMLEINDKAASPACRPWANSASRRTSIDRTREPHDRENSASRRHRRPHRRMLRWVACRPSCGRSGPPARTGRLWELNEPRFDARLSGADR